MKLLITLTILASTVFAMRVTKVMDFYPGNFDLVEVSPMCPPNSNGVSCMAIGSLIKVKSYAGCLGEKAFFDAQVVSERGLTKVYITSLIKTDLEMEMRVRCVRLKEIKETIVAPMHISGDVLIINKENRHKEL